MMMSIMEHCRRFQRTCMKPLKLMASLAGTHLDISHYQNLKSALVPLSLLGFIWTFNMFNVIYLMTAKNPSLYFGEPGQTDILITYV